MGLYVIPNMNSFCHPESVRYVALLEESRIHARFFDTLKLESYDGKDPLRKDNITSYFKECGMEYLGNYRFLYENEGEREERFIGSLDTTQQLAIIALWKSEFDLLVVVQETDFQLEPKWIAPVLRKRDLYLLQPSWYDYSRWYEPSINGIAEMGIPVYFEGRCSVEFSDQMSMQNLIWQLVSRDSYLTRELDAEVFDESRIYVPGTQMKLPQYMESKLEDEFDLRQWKDYLEEHPQWKEIRVTENAKNNYANGLFPQHEFHSLFYSDGKWWHWFGYTDSYPNFMDIVLDAVLEPEPIWGKKEHPVNQRVARAEKIFTLVLDNSYNINARKYWEWICVLVKYDRKTQELEICRHDTGLLEFHRLLQESEDLEI